jgi:hypothetical protein
MKGSTTRWSVWITSSNCGVCMSGSECCWLITGNEPVLRQSESSYSSTRTWSWKGSKDDIDYSQELIFFLLEEFAGKGSESRRAAFPGRVRGIIAFRKCRQAVGTSTIELLPHHNHAPSHPKDSKHSLLDYAEKGNGDVQALIRYRIVSLPWSECFKFYFDDQNRLPKHHPM